DDNKRTRTGNAFATTTNHVERENAGAWPKCATCNSYHAPIGPCRTCFNCNRTSHLAKDCRGVPRNVNTVNARNPPVKACYECGSIDHVRSACPRWNRAQGVEGNHPNLVVANNEGQGQGNQENQANVKTFMLGADEARQDLNVMTGTFTLNKHFATTLFDSSADYSIVSTTFIPLLGIEPNELGFRYEIKITSKQLIEIDKVVKGCRLEIEGHVFDIDLIPFGHGSFYVIICMDWLSNHKTEIICHKKVVRIPLLDGKVLRVLGERLKEKARLLMIAKASDKNLEEIVMVRYFPKVFPGDLFGLSPVREIELIPGATSVAKYPYRLAPSELEELSDSRGACRTLKVSLGTAQKGEITLKDKLCNAPVLALLDRPEDFVVYCDASGIGLGYVLMQRERVEYDIAELFSDYDCEIRYHPGMANMVADALSRKERVKPMRVRAMNMILQSSIKDMILVAQKETVDEIAKLKKGIAMYFRTKLPRTSSGHDTIWVIVGRLTKSAHFLPMLEDYKMDRLARLYLNEIVAKHGVSISIISDHDSCFTSRFWQSIVRRAPFEALYGRKCRSPIMCAEVREGQLIGPELLQETTENISQIKDRLKASHDR
nr:putative reverse transcriptase domain-containing protein [Tanacetum cinerariifolium]